MKNFKIISTCLLTLGILSASAAVHTVDNNPTSNAQFATIAAAIAAASDNDTILIQPSAVDYGNVTINKPLVIIGSGHNTAFGHVVTATTMISSSNVTIDGIYVIGNGIGINGNNSNIIVRNCRMTNVGVGANCNNIVISGNIIDQFSQIGNTSSNILVLNNIINGANSFVGNCESIIFKSNIITAYYYLFNSNSASATFTDNIFYLQSANAFNLEACINCSFQNNLTYSPLGTVVDSPNSTLNNVAPTWDLNGLTTPAFNYSINYQMLSGAPATGASDGGQVGIYGAGFDFHMNGFPLGIPRVTLTNVANPVVFPGGSIQVNFEAEAGSN